MGRYALFLMESEAQAAPAESTTLDGLTVSYDEETGTFTFDWDEETHPQYNYLKELTEEMFTEMLMKAIEENLTEEQLNSIKEQVFED